MIKQVYASLEFDENELRLLIAELFNSRFNVLKLIKVPCKGIDNFQIIDSASLKTAVYDAANQAHEYLGAKLEKVILLIPPLFFKKISIKVDVDEKPNGINRNDILNAINSTRNINLEDGYVCVNRVINRFVINGVPSRKLNDNEYINTCSISLDLLCSKKGFVYSYCRLIESCGLEIVDICLSNYASCREASLFERSINNVILLVDYKKDNSIISILSKGHIVDSKVFPFGINDCINALKEKYNLDYSVLNRLLKYGLSNDNSLNNIIYAYSNGSFENVSITKFDLSEIINPIINRQIDFILEDCENILNQENVLTEIIGEGSDFESFIKLLDERTNCDVKIYHPETFGARESICCSLLGSMFNKYEYSSYSLENIQCIDILEFEKTIDNSKINTEGQTITTKIRSLFNQYFKGEK